MALKFRSQFKQHTVQALRERFRRNMQRRINKIPFEPRVLVPGAGKAFLDRMREQQQ